MDRIDKVSTKLVWNTRVFRRLGFNEQTGKRLPSRKIKSFHGSKRELEYIVHGFGLKQGDIIQTCRDYFNHRIEKIDHVQYCDSRWRDDNSKDSYVNNINFITTDGYLHNWMDCCNLPLPIAAIEKYYLNSSKEVLEIKFEDSFEYHWTDDKNEAKEKYNKHIAWSKVLIDRLEQGLPICDEYGICLPELEYKTFTS